MPITIAVAGKGGTGKTTVTALIIDHLARLGVGDILAVDADPSTNLNLALGVELEDTVGGEREALLEDIQTGRYNLGLEKRQYFELKIREALVEADAFDLIAMGRPEGPGCYCAPNHILRQSIDAISGGYDFVVIDNEAGLEHISRRTTRDVDLLLVVSDPTVRGLIAARRVFDLVDELDTRIGQAHLLINRVPVDEAGEPQLASELAARVEELGLPLLGLLPQDDLVSELDASGKPLVDLPDDSRLRRQLVSLIGRVLPVAVPL
ncbi:MAG: AAA family ATPase [Anaerolineae bacterium]